MSKKSDIQKIWRECFPEDSARWRRMFFDAVYVDDEALTLTEPDSDHIVSSLLLLSYSMTFQGRNVGLAYVYGAGTLRRFRARGYMSRLLRQALREASDRGDTFAALIPARPSLRRYYGRFGFSTVFYSRPERYTAIHRFPTQGQYRPVDPADPRLYDAFAQLMGRRQCCVQHSRAQFLTIMDDAQLSGYGFAAVEHADSGEIAAMVWAAPEVASQTLNVIELLADDADAANAALTALQQQMPGRPLTLMRHPADSAAGGNLIAGGMARVVNAESALRAVAENNPNLQLTIRLTDPILPENNGIYTLSRGTLRIADLTANTPCDLDLTPEVLTSMLFSSSPISAITGLPSRRAHMSLMLG